MLKSNSHLNSTMLGSTVRKSHVSLVDRELSPDRFPKPYKYDPRGIITPNIEEQDNKLKSPVKVA